jgi:hypothetical protein
MKRTLTCCLGRRSTTRKWVPCTLNLDPIAGGEAQLVERPEAAPGLLLVRARIGVGASGGVVRTKSRPPRHRKKTRDSRIDVSFNGEIRPLLSDRCFACHGPDGGKDGGNWKGGLPLDKEADAFADLVLYLIKLVLIKPKLARFPHRALAFHLSREGGICAFTLAS